MPLGNDIMATAGLDTRDFQKGMDTLGKDTGKFIKGITTAFAGLSLVRLGREVLNFADATQDASEKLDLTAESLQRFESAFNKTGASSDKFQRGFGIFLEKVDEARNGSTELVKKFQAVGITLDDLKSKGGEELFLQMADGIKNSRDNAEMLRKSTDLLGKSGRDLKTGLSQGADGLRDSMKAAVVATDEEIAKLGELSDRLAEIKRTAMSMTASAASFDLIGAITGDSEVNAAREQRGARLEVEAAQRNKQKRKDEMKREFEERKAAEVKAAEDARKQIEANDWGSSKTDPMQDAISAGIDSVGDNTDAKHEAYVEDWENSYNDMIDREKEAKDKANEESKKAFEDSANKLVDAGSKIQQKIEDAANTIGMDKRRSRIALAGKAADFQKTGQERRADRQAERDQARAERTVAKREADTAARKAAGSYSNQEERAAMEAEKRKGFFGEEGKKNLGKSPTPAVQKPEESLKSIDERLAELVKLYGKTTKG